MTSCSEIPEECYAFDRTDDATSEEGMDLWTQTKLSPWQEYCAKEIPTKMALTTQSYRMGRLQPL